MLSRVSGQPNNLIVGLSATPRLLGAAVLGWNPVPEQTRDEPVLPNLGDMVVQRARHVRLDSGDEAGG